jgi:signal transduction histidine kinase
MKKIFSIKIGGYLISILAILLVGISYFFLGDRSFYMVRGSIIAFLVATVILEYMSYRIRNVIDYFRNPLTIVMGVADSLKAENLPPKEREQLIFLKKTLDNMERMYNEIT